MSELMRTSEPSEAVSPSRMERRLRQLLARSERQLVELELSLSGLLGDSGTLQEDRDNTRIVIEAIRADVWATRRALARVADGTYGRCLRCGTPIAPARLEAIPIVEHCAACA